MPEVILYGWKPGLHTINCIKTIRRYREMGLKEAKDIVDEMLQGTDIVDGMFQGHPVSLGTGTDAWAASLVRELTEWNALARIEPTPPGGDSAGAAHGPPQ